jgi:hypothetical protein
MTPQIIGIILIFIGIFHVLKPDLFRRLMWRKIVFNPQRYSRQQHKMYMRFLGGISYFNWYIFNRCKISVNLINFFHDGNLYNFL